MLFLGLFYFIIIQEGPLYLTYHQMQAEVVAKESDSAVSKLLTQLDPLSLDQLLPYLEDKTVLEDHLAVRDLALALLIEKNHFDFNRAILGYPEPTLRPYKIAHQGQVSQLNFYSNLTDAHYKAITEFARQELFPIPEALPEIPAPVIVEKAPLLHLVQEGESLWKIARLHQVNIDQLRALNQLKSDQIRPGQKLLLP